MLNMATITKAAQDQLNADSSVTAIPKNGRVLRSEYINTEPANAPWAGVYKGEIDYSPRTLGVGADNWEGMPSFKVVVQNANMKSGEACEDDLESYVKTFKDALIADPTLGGAVDMITAVKVEYGYIESDRSTMYFQSAVITVTVEAKTQ